MYLTISKICTVSTRPVLSQTTVRNLMPELQSCANGTIAFAKIRRKSELSKKVGEKWQKSYKRILAV